MKRKLISAAVAAVLTVTSVAPAVAAPTEPISIATRAEARIPIIVDDIEIFCDQPPVIVEDRTLVPLRAIFEALGAEVYWDNDARSVTATKEDTTIFLAIGSSVLYKNGEATYMDVPGQIINDRTMVPVRAVSESFGAKVYWDNDTRTVRVYTDAYTEPEEPSEPENPGTDEPAEPENPGVDDPDINEPTEPNNPGEEEPVDPEGPGIDEPTEPVDPVPPVEEPDNPNYPTTEPEDPVDNAWKQSYIDYINQKESYWTSMFGYESWKGRYYKLVDINGDNVLELYSSFGSTASGDTICTCSNGELVEQWMWIMGFEYVDGKNIFKSTGGNMGYYYDEIYTIQNGRFKMLDKITYEMISGGSPDDRQFRYYWNDIEISEVEYHNHLGKYFNEDQLISPYDNTVFDFNIGRYIGNDLRTAQEIIQEIQAY